MVEIIRDGVLNQEMPIQGVQVGDLLKIKGGIEIPGDGIIVEANSIQIDESSLTGETQPMKKNILSYAIRKRDEALSSGKKLKHHSLPSVVVLSGTKVMSGTGKMIITCVGKNSTIGSIEESLKSEDELTPLQMKLEKIARDIGIFGLIAAVLIFLVLSIRLIVEESQDGWEEDAGHYFQEFLEYFLLAIAILVVAIPEGLPLAVTLSLAFSVNKMAEDNNLVRKMQACETMGGANIICSDKTGTLTRNEMYWTHFWNGKEYKVFDAETNECKKFGTFTTDESSKILLNTVILNSKEDPASTVGNPTEMALLKYFHLQNLNVIEYRNKLAPLHSGPFNSDRKRMSTIVRLENGKEYCFMKGASEYMLQVSNKFHKLENNEVTPLG